jgi:hypothetical protein
MQKKKNKKTKDKKKGEFEYAASFVHLADLGRVGD